MKKIINKPENVVTEMLDGLAYVHSDLVHRVDGFDIIVRNEQAAGQVGLISGGGSGHEPAHAGFVGDGMLSAAIAAGVFMIFKNYSGDIMNFEMAQELAEMEGIEVASVVVDDDIAVENSLYTQGRRGVAGTIFVHKILGHAAREGKSLAEIKDLADKIVPNIHTIGLALSGATVPEVGKPGFVLAEDEIEYGIGIHGEPGYRKESMQPSRQLAEELTGKLLEAFEAKLGERYALLINGMGATPLMEQYVFANDVASILGEVGLEVAYKKLGNYMTSIDMAGLSLTLMKIENDAWLEVLESPVKTIAW